MSPLAISISDAEGSPTATRRIRSDRGIALIVVLLVTTVLSALGLALTLMTSTETTIAAGYARSAETFYAADAGIEATLRELSMVADWTAVLEGSAESTFVDGSPGPRALGTGAHLDLGVETGLLNCGHAGCSADEMIATTDDRPWGLNNPVWRLYAHGPIAALGAPGSVDSRAYVAVWVSDDPLDNDGQPLVDGNETNGANPGKGVLQIRVQAYGPGAARRAIEVTIRRVPAGIRVLSWREIRR